METKPEYVTEAIEMLGKGYEHEPSLEVEAPRKVTERRNGKLIETERAAFVKIYTTFKNELADLDGDDLKIWLYLALSVNRYTKDARPGLRKIAHDLKMAVNTLRLGLDRLEEKGLLDIEKEDGKTNAYRPSDYVSVSKFDTVTESTVSKNRATVSVFEPTVSVSRKENAQLEELEELDSNRYTPDPVFAALENLTGGLNSNTTRFVDTWREKHTDEWILKAVEMSKGKSIKYADSILIGWEANGYPKSREERVQERKQNKQPSQPASEPRAAESVRKWLAAKQAQEA